MAEHWKFEILHQESRSRHYILEGHAYPPYERPYYDELFFYLTAGPDFLSLEVSPDFDGQRLLAYLFERLGQPEEPPRIQVGGRQDEEDGALLLVAWRFPLERRGAILKRLSAIFL